MKKLLISTLLSVIFILGSTIPAFATPNNGSSIANNIISSIDSEISAVENNIAENNKEISQVNRNLEAITNEINEKEETLKKKQLILDERTRELYKNNNGTNLYLDALFSSNSISDLISNIHAVSKVIAFDKAAMEEINEIVKDLESKETELNNKKTELNNLKQKNQDKLIQLQKQRDAKAALQYEINQSNGSNGSTLLEDLGQASGTAQQIIQYGYKYIGYPYVYGANGPNAFDCSSFMQHIFGHFGISLPRVTYDQVNVGTPVSYNNLKPGDLVFTEGSASRPNHVGVYVGGGQMLHASKPGVGIIVGPIYNFKTARRIL